MSLCDGSADVVDSELTGNLTLSSGANFDLNGHTLVVTGNFSTTINSGQLTMKSAAGVLTVNGNVTFNGGGENTLLTAGEIEQRSVDGKGKWTSAQCEF